MTESEFLTLAEHTLSAIERAFERATEQTEMDIECSRSGNVIDIEFIDTGSKIIINSQTPMQEIWVAAKSGGFHFRYADNQWLNTRDGTALFDTLSQLASAQGGAIVKLQAS